MKIEDYLTREEMRETMRKLLLAIDTTGEGGGCFIEFLRSLSNGIDTGIYIRKNQKGA